jgi:WD40 repeat protein/DNA-binding SARP family transcriptional activator
MEFGILGPLEVRSEQGNVAVAGGKPAAVLAVLLLHPNEPVSVDKLAIALWGEDVPGGASRTVQVHVSRLRKALGNPEALITTPAGYCLVVKPGELDATRFEELVRSGRQTLANGEAAQASDVLREALTLWRGPPLADFASEPFAPAEIARLEEQRLEALETRLEADLAAGRHHDVVGELQHLVAEHPTREQLVEHLMLALYRCGRQTEALEAYRDAHRMLLDEIGVEPRSQLRELQAAILRQDPALDPPAATELPSELDPLAATPLVGRDAELGVLRERWEAARAGRGSVVAITGGRGTGKTRVAAELARAVHRRGAAVLLANGNGRALFDAVARARDAQAPTLLVLDNADQVPAEVRAELSGQLRAVTERPVLALVTGDDDEALADLGADVTVVLEPLGLAAVREIATLYAPGHAGDGMPEEWLFNVSGGVPRRVHEIAGDWARREAARRVNAVAGRAAAGRADLRSIESELTDGVQALEAARERVDRMGDGQDETVVCPFKGLASFEVADAPYFFGREQLVAQLVARLVGAPMLGVIGPSGSGKSSVVQAGLLPALAGGVLPGSRHWRQVVLRPGEHPVRAMSAAAGIGDGERFVLAVDQFEEVFTACRDESQRTRFIDELVRLARGNGVIVLAIRADQYGRCAEYPELSNLLAANQVLVGAMGRDELLRAVEFPAERAGLRVDAALSRALVDDVQGEPGALPLLSTALLELWQQREGRRLTNAAYERAGGVQGAVARLGEDAFRALDAEQQQTARQVLLALVAESSEGTVERRRIRLDELEMERSEDVRRIVEVLAERRLLTLSEGSVEVAHEALLREWPRLRSWIEEDRERIRIHRSLHAAAADWLEHDRNDDWLYRGSHLLEAREWEEQGTLGLTGDEREFLAASEADARRHRTARRRRLAVAFGSLVVGLVVICIVALVAIHQRRDADRQKAIAISRELAAESIGALDVDPELGLRLALWAYDTSPTAQAVTAMREATLAFRQLNVLRADSLDAWAAAYSPDGTRVVTGGTDGNAILWDAGTGRKLRSFDANHRELLAARFAPGGERIALGFGDGTVLTTDASLGAPHTILAVKGKRVEDLALSGDGRRIAAAFEDGTVRVLAADGTGEVKSLTGNTDAALGVDLDREGRRVVSAGKDGSVRLWDVADGGERVLRGGGEAQNDVAFSPDGSQILSVGDDGWIRVWRGNRATRISGEGRELTAVAFSADGRRFAAGGNDGVTRVWSAAGGPPIAVLRGQRSRIYDLGFNATGDRLVSAGDDGTARIWSTGRIRAWHVPGDAWGFDFNRDGRQLATSSADGTVRVWDSATGRLLARQGGPAGYVAAKFSPVSDTLAIPTWEASLLRSWRVGDEPARVVVKAPHVKGVESARFDPTGKRILYVADKPGIVLRDLDSGREIRYRGGPKSLIYDAVFSPDGKYIAALPESGAVPVWRTDRPGSPQRTLKGHEGHVQSLDFSPDGRIVTAGADRTVRVWGLDGRPLILRGHEDEVTTVAFTPDGRKVLSSSDDGTLRLWDANTGDQLAILQSDEGKLKDVAVSPEGRIATLDKGDMVRVFSCEVCGSVADVRGLALARSPRELTTAERQDYLAAAD